MYLSPQARAANAYRDVGAMTRVQSAGPGQMVLMLFDALREQLLRAKTAMLEQSFASKGRAITMAVRILDEGLKAPLEKQHAAQLGQSLSDLYDYCIARLTHANLRNDAEAIDEVGRLLAPVEDAWRQISVQPMTTPKTAEFA